MATTYRPAFDSRSQRYIPPLGMVRRRFDFMGQWSSVGGADGRHTCPPGCASSQSYAVAAGMPEGGGVGHSTNEILPE